MMFKIIILSVLAAVVVAAPKNLKDKADPCTDEVCKPPDCRCASINIPGGLQPSDTPQFVFLTFDDAVRADNHDLYTELFYNKKNPDGCDIGITYFTSHEYTDYSKINDLYQHGHEIALHSISHSASTNYWQNQTVDQLKGEFADEAVLISTFANIPKESLKGIRLPFLQLSGDNSFEMIKESGLQYDCSWPTLRYMKPGLWPYTLDYLSNQDCPIGPCPTKSQPGVWVAPMVDWADLNGTVCSMVDACQIIPVDKDDELVEWMKTNFQRHYEGNRAPFGFYVHAAWFLVEDAHLSAYKKFVDYLQSLKDVYIVGVSKGLEWVKNPVPLGSADWPKCELPEPTSCTPQACRLMKGSEERYMTVCGECPNIFPWLGNPLGK